MFLRHPVLWGAAALILFSGCGRKTSSRAPSVPSASTKNQATAPAKAKPRALVISPRFQGALQARLDQTYAVVILADGSRTLAPLESLEPDDLTWLTALAKEHPLAKGKSSVMVVADTTPAKKTIQVSKIEEGTETVQLCPPNVIRDQIGGTCMMYARVHWLDIAGYYVDLPALYKIINDTPPDHPWTSPRYVAGLTGVLQSFKSKPIVHDLPAQEEPFVWARQELRRGRPLLAALPKEVWQALPAGFIAAHPWNGGSVGHQIVVNGFTWNETSQQGTFHVVNSWAELTEFDLSTEAAKRGILVFEQSLSPVGEPQAAAVKEVVQSITFLKAAGTTNLYEVETNLGTRRIAAPSEESVRDMVEAGR